MNKIDKKVIEAVCKESTSISSIMEYNKEPGVIVLNFPAVRLVNKMGITVEMIDEVLKKFMSDGYFISVESKENDRWFIKAKYPKLIDMFNEATKGNKLTFQQTGIKRRMADKLKELRDHYSKTQSYEEIERSFDQGKWLRLCCPACGDFIQEITSYKEFRELANTTIECRRHKHKCKYSIEGNIIEFTSVEIGILPLLREKRS